MSTELKQRYNKRVVPTPDIQADVPPVQRPEKRFSAEAIARARKRLRTAVAIAGLLGLIGALAAAFVTLGGPTPLWP